VANHILCLQRAEAIGHASVFHLLVGDTGGR
jgi:hypothetical protein